MATGDRSPVLWRRAARTGKRKARRAGQWRPRIGPVGLRIAVAAASWADPQVVSPSGLPGSGPTHPEPGLPAFNFNQGGRRYSAGGDTRTSGTRISWG